MSVLHGTVPKFEQDKPISRELEDTICRHDRQAVMGRHRLDNDIVLHSPAPGQSGSWIWTTRG